MRLSPNKTQTKVAKVVNTAKGCVKKGGDRMNIGGRHYDEIVIMNEKGEVLCVISDKEKEVSQCPKK